MQLPILPAAPRAALPRRQWLAFVGLGTLLTACGGSGGEPLLLDPEQADLQSRASDLVTEGLVGTAVGWADVREVRTAVAGLRRLGGRALLEPGDLMAIGSNTKAMTACVAASVVDQGLLRWDSTLAQVLPELARDALPAYRHITLRALLDHRAGVMAFTAPADIGLFEQQAGEPVLVGLQQPAEVEAFFLRWLLQQPPIPATGALPGYAYSNAGYALAARMLRAATGLGWADLLRQRVAQPLGLALFVGAPLRHGGHQPQGHEVVGGRLQPQALPEAPERAWFEILEPAGAVSLTVRDDALWLQWHLRALRGEATPLPRSYVQALQGLGRTPADNYVLGWVAQTEQGSGWLVHTGQTLGFQAVSVVALDGSRAGLAHSNTATDDSLVRLFEAVTGLLS
ncbi:penicillin-binding protein, beta-lactamase class C [Acidovorax sp. CF316]|uniref:serine hydrolase domain-containing protein n=1 Tax=Acidovorax sp. CF316 TaxID=1144317 RepID=UPI00026BC40C|nr:serine hydrolase domain-containing protein [Acidovorax sp. CF316]EJE49045.1 penicillin-binding protein, beta-lactamase class C [Acidovorax sp. CF316]